MLRVAFHLRDGNNENGMAIVEMKVRLISEIIL